MGFVLLLAACCAQANPDPATELPAPRRGRRLAGRPCRFPERSRTLRSAASTVMHSSCLQTRVKVRVIRCEPGDHQSLLRTPGQTHTKGMKSPTAIPTPTNMTGRHGANVSRLESLDGIKERLQENRTRPLHAPTQSTPQRPSDSCLLWERTQTSAPGRPKKAKL